MAKNSGFSAKVKNLNYWELRELSGGKLVAKGDLGFVTERMLAVPNGVYGVTHFMIPSGGYYKHIAV